MNLVREVRIRLGMTQEALGKRLGVTSACISHWELGLRRPLSKFREIMSLAREVGIEATEEEIHRMLTKRV